MVAGISPMMDLIPRIVGFKFSIRRPTPPGSPRSTASPLFSAWTTMTAITATSTTPPAKAMLWAKAYWPPSPRRAMQLLRPPYLCPASNQRTAVSFPPPGRERRRRQHCLFAKCSAAARLRIDDPMLLRWWPQLPSSITAGCRSVARTCRRLSNPPTS